jgi:TATA-box binding protein (TBP) (component of TFIID and TFIIIB)
MTSIISTITAIGNINAIINLKVEKALRISTITAIGNINAIINLQEIYNLMITKYDKNDNIIENDNNDNIIENDNNDNIIENDDKLNNNILFLEYGSNKNISNSKGINPKIKKNLYNKKNESKKKQKKRFDNQLTIILDLYDNYKNYINMKVFKNGKIQMTGLKSIEQGHTAIEIIINVIKKIYTTKSINILNSTSKYEDIKLSDYKICLINSDFKFNYKIRRNKLFEYIINNTKIICSYEPCIYPGVKIQFYYNNKKNGICDCENFCLNKNLNSNCIKITIAIFESGCTIITGAKNIEQIDNTYNFIVNLLNTNLIHFEKIDLDKLLI